MTKKVMTPSAETISAGQIGKICDLVSARLRKSGLPFESVQQIMETEGDTVADEVVAVVRRHVEAISGLIIRRVKVNRDRSPKEVLDATGCEQYSDPEVVVAMPKGEGEEVEVYFFKPESREYTRPGWMSEDDLKKAFDRRGFKPADPYSQAAVNEVYPGFSYEYPSATNWKDSGNRGCVSLFSRWRVKGHVRVCFSEDGWHDGWWFAGLRK